MQKWLKSKKNIALLLTGFCLAEASKNTWVLCNFSSNGGKAYGVGEEVAGGNLIMFFLRPYFAHNECVCYVRVYGAVVT